MYLGPPSPPQHFCYFTHKIVDVRGVSKGILFAVFGHVMLYMTGHINNYVSCDLFINDAWSLGKFPCHYGGYVYPAMIILLCQQILVYS